MAAPASPSLTDANLPGPSIEWVKDLELDYERNDNIISKKLLCFGCGSAGSDDSKELSKCCRCQVAMYCSKECQVSDWKKGGHKHACKFYVRLDVNNDRGRLKTENKATARTDIYGRFRLYACAYNVHKCTEIGKGFLFIQSECSLATLSLPIPTDGYGHKQVRSVLMHYLTMGEYDVEVCRDDFEMAQVRGELLDLVNTYDEEKSIVLLMRFRCGHLAVGLAPLVPDFAVCKKLGKDYFANENSAGALQLNLDDL